jgi:PKD repeat protein
MLNNLYIKPISGGLDLTIAASATSIVTNASITFTGGCTNGTPTNWRWDFGDGTTSSLQNPTKTYRYAGSYTVTLSATDGTADGFFIFGTAITVTLQATPTTGLQADYQALIGASPPNATLVAGAISQWDDSSGNGYHLTQGTAINRPTYNSSLLTFNGVTYGGGVFDGVNDFLSAITIPRGTSSIVVMVWRLNVMGLSFQTPHIAQSGVSHVLQIISNVQMGFRLNNGTSRDTTLQYPTNLFYVLRTTFDNSTGGKLRFNNFPEYSTANTGSSTATGICFGAFTGAVSPVNMTLVEAKVYNALSGADETNLQNYLSSKFGLW